MPNIHPLVVHFPVALLTFSLFCDLGARILPGKGLDRAGWWSQLAGTLGLIGAVISGLAAKGGVTLTDAARSTLELHEQIAFAAGTMFFALLFWRIAHRTHIPDRISRFYLVLMAGSTVLLWVGAWYGGEMVYSFGTGVLSPIR